MDEHLIERSEALNAQHLEWRLQEIRNNVNSKELEPAGYCHNCHEVFEGKRSTMSPKLFCDDECAKEWNEWYQGKIRRYGPSFAPCSAY